MKWLILSAAALTLTVNMCGSASAQIRVSDEEKFQGIWQYEVNPRFTMRFHGDLYMEKEDPKGPRWTHGGTFKLDPTKSPKWIDIQYKGGPLVRGIYAIDGSKIRIRLEFDGKRPMNFGDDPIILKRANPGDVAPEGEVLPGASVLDSRARFNAQARAQRNSLIARGYRLHSVETSALRAAGLARELIHRGYQVDTVVFDSSRGLEYHVYRRGR